MMIIIHTAFVSAWCYCGLLTRTWNNSTNNSTSSATRSRSTTSTSSTTSATSAGSGPVGYRDDLTSGAAEPSSSLTDGSEGPILSWAASLSLARRLGVRSGRQFRASLERAQLLCSPLTWLLYHSVLSLRNRDCPARPSNFLRFVIDCSS